MHLWLYLCMHFFQYYYLCIIIPHRSSCPPGLSQSTMDSRLSGFSLCATPPTTPKRRPQYVAWENTQNECEITTQQSQTHRCEMSQYKHSNPPPNEEKDDPSSPCLPLWTDLWWGEGEVEWSALLLVERLDQHLGHLVHRVGPRVRLVLHHARVALPTPTWSIRHT